MGWLSLVCPLSTGPYSERQDHPARRQDVEERRGPSKLWQHQHPRFAHHHLWRGLPSDAAGRAAEGRWEPLSFFFHSANALHSAEERASFLHWRELDNKTLGCLWAVLWSLPWLPSKQFALKWSNNDDYWIYMVHFCGTQSTTSAVSNMRPAGQTWPCFQEYLGQQINLEKKKTT